MRSLFFIVRKNFFFLLLTLVSVMTLLPLLRYGPMAVFYHVDPDVIYVGNAISYVKSHLIFYKDHPGTPAIVMLAWSYWPLRLYAKLIEHQPFVSWCFDNLRFLLLYSRFFFFLVFAFSLFIYLKAVWLFTKSKLTTIFALLGLFLFTPFFELGAKIYAEHNSFFYFSLWLFVFSGYVLRKKPFYLYLLSVFAGLGMATKLNNYVLLVASLGLAFFGTSRNLLDGVKKTGIAGSLIACAFFASTWSIKPLYKPMFTRFFSVMLHSGIEGAHGAGGTPFIDFTNYATNLRNLFISNNTSLLVAAATIIAFLILFLKKRVKVLGPVGILLFSTVASSLILLKYPNTYYQLPSYLIYLFLGCFLFAKINRYLKVLLLAILLVVLVPRVVNNLHYEMKLARSAVELEDEIAKNSHTMITLWDYGPARDFAFIWIRAWARGTFLEELAAKRPDLLELDADYKRVYSKYYYDVHDVWQICWDKLYIREDRAKVFLAKYPGKKLVIKPVGDTGIWEIQSKHCNTNGKPLGVFSR